jgi:hypothetical protein
MPPFVLLLLAASIALTWSTSVSLGRKYGKASGIAIFSFITGPLVIFSYRTYLIQEQCFAEQKWTAGAMVWVSVMIAEI